MPTKSTKPEQPPTPQRPNILLITCDQFRFPRFSYGPDAGFDQDLKEILGFQAISPGNKYLKFFPGLLRLRKNAVVLRNHTIAASACTPSRAVIYTGQYGTRTGVTQTDGLFKNGDSPNFPWLDAAGIPTMGDWMRQAGYTTHYFGKWHVSNPPEHSLRRYGFDNWEPSYPEPHGSQPNNLGMYRDVGFTDQACEFIRRQGLALNYDRVTASEQAADPSAAGPTAMPPWFAVASFTNPHDIATYPGVIAQALPGDVPITITVKGKTYTLDKTRKTQPMFGPLTIPEAGDRAMPPILGTMQFALNPLDFPQDCAAASPTQGEDLLDKPSCQRDYAYKMGIALGAKAGFNIVGGFKSAGIDLGLTHEDQVQLAVDLGLKTCIPFQLSDDPDGGCVQFIQLYAWLHSVVDKHIDAVLQALEDSGQADNTIVMFLADHGEYAAAHGMMLEKWHTAYQEALHVPVVVNYRPVVKNAIAQEGKSAPAHAPVAHNDILRQCDALTSHVDILPTVLGLAGVGLEDRIKIGRALAMSRPVPPLPGVDLAPLIRGEWGPGEVIEADGAPRKGVLFITDDEITAPLPFERNAHDINSMKEFEVYKQAVDAVRGGAKGDKVALWPGSVRQPNNLRCVRTMDTKLVRYFDPSGKEAQEWEMYDLANDPNEAISLVEIHKTPPTAKSKLPAWADPATVQSKANELDAMLKELEARFLS